MCYLFRNTVELSLKRIDIEDTVTGYDKVIKVVRSSVLSYEIV